MQFWEYMSCQVQQLHLIKTVSALLMLFEMVPVMINPVFFLSRTIDWSDKGSSNLKHTFQGQNPFEQKETYF